MNFIKMVTFSLKPTLFVDVWTSYSTSSQYYFPLTAPRISSPYVKGKCGFGWGKGLKTMPKTVHFKRKEELRLCIILFCLFLRWFSSLYLNQNHTGIWSPYVNGKCLFERKRHHFDEIHSTAFTIGFPTGIHRTFFFSRELFEKPQEKSGFSIENRNSEAHCFSERV